MGLAKGETRCSLFCGSYSCMPACLAPQCSTRHLLHLLRGCDRFLTMSSMHVAGCQAGTSASSFSSLYVKEGVEPVRSPSACMSDLD